MLIHFCQICKKFAIHFIWKPGHSLMTRKPSLDSAETGADIFQSWPFTYGPSRRKIPPVRRVPTDTKHPRWSSTQQFPPLRSYLNTWLDLTSKRKNTSYHRVAMLARNNRRIVCAVSGGARSRWRITARQLMGLTDPIREECRRLERWLWNSKTVVGLSLRRSEGTASHTGLRGYLLTTALFSPFACGDGPQQLSPLNSVAATIWPKVDICALSRQVTLPAPEQFHRRIKAFFFSSKQAL